MLLRAINTCPDCNCLPNFEKSTVSTHFFSVTDQNLSAKFRQSFTKKSPMLLRQIGKSSVSVTVREFYVKKKNCYPKQASPESRRHVTGRSWINENQMKTTNDNPMIAALWLHRSQSRDCLRQGSTYLLLWIALGSWFRGILWRIIPWSSYPKNRMNRAIFFIFLQKILKSVYSIVCAPFFLSFTHKILYNILNKLRKKLLI